VEYCRIKEKMMEELMELLEALKPEIDFETEKELIDDGLLESFDMITLIAEIEDQFGVEIPAEEIVPENFNSAEEIWSLITRVKEEA
jgi:acyl carrier protein